MTAPIDPAMIMADHHGSPGDVCYGDNYDCGYIWPCPTYKLADEVLRLRGQIDQMRWVEVDLNGTPLALDAEPGDPR